MNVRTKPIQPSHSLLWWSGLFVAAAFGVAGYLTNFIAEGIIACVIVLFGILFFRDRHTRSKLGAALRNIENSTTDGMLIDIAERRQAEEKKDENETTIHGLVEQSLVGVFIVDEAGRLVYVNPRFAQTIGYEGAADFIGKPLIDFISDADKPAVREAMSGLLSGKVATVEIAAAMLQKQAAAIDVIAQGSLSTFHGKSAIVGVVVLEKSGLPPHLLELELTETVLMEASDEHNEVLVRLRKSGVRLAIDDFGTGYSSLDYLRRYPADRVKIAQDFVRQIAFDPGSAAIVRATIALARELGMVAIAEGVETREQFELLKAWGCTQMQGFYFAKPLAPEDVLPLLLRGRILEPTATFGKAAA